MTTTENVAHMFVEQFTANAKSCCFCVTSILFNVYKTTLTCKVN